MKLKRILSIACALLLLCTSLVVGVSAEDDHICKFDIVEYYYPSTCTTWGSSKMRCACGRVMFSDSGSNPLNHDWGEWTEANGMQSRTCARDSRHVETKPLGVPDHEHEYEMTFTPSTYTEEGFTTCTCACGSVSVTGFCPKLTRYISIWGRQTGYKQTFLSWFLCIVCFGWLWMK